MVSLEEGLNLIKGYQCIAYEKVQNQREIWGSQFFVLLQISSVFRPVFGYVNT